MPAHRPAVRGRPRIRSRGYLSNISRRKSFCIYEASYIPRNERQAAWSSLAQLHNQVHLIKLDHAQHPETTPPRDVTRPKRPAALDLKNLCGGGQKVMAAAHGNAVREEDVNLIEGFISTSCDPIVRLP